MHDRADINKHSLVEVGDRAVSDTLGNYLAVANDHVVQLALEILHRFLELASDLVGLLNVAVNQLDIGVVAEPEQFASVVHILHHQRHLFRVLIPKKI